MEGGQSERRIYPVTAAEYKLLEEIGQGVSATVYRAICLPFKEVVAIKALDLEKCNSNLVRGFDFRFFDFCKNNIYFSGIEIRGIIHLVFELSGIRRFPETISVWDHQLVEYVFEVNFWDFSVVGIHNSELPLVDEWVRRREELGCRTRWRNVFVLKNFAVLRTPVLQYFWIAFESLFATIATSNLLIALWLCHETKMLNKFRLSSSVARERLQRMIRFK